MLKRPHRTLGDTSSSWREGAQATRLRASRSAGGGGSDGTRAAPGRLSPRAAPAAGRGSGAGSAARPSARARAPRGPPPPPPRRHWLHRCGPGTIETPPSLRTNAPRRPSPAALASCPAAVHLALRFPDRVPGPGAPRGFPPPARARSRSRLPGRLPST